MNKHLIRAAKQIADLESKINQEKNVEENQEKIEQILNDFTVEEMMEIDEYIISNRLIKD